MEYAIGLVVFLAIMAWLLVIELLRARKPSNIGAQIAAAGYGRSWDRRAK